MGGRALSHLNIRRGRVGEDGKNEGSPAIHILKSRSHNPPWSVDRRYARACRALSG